jgi:hypothetical protein
MDFCAKPVAAALTIFLVLVARREIIDKPRNAATKRADSCAFPAAGYSANRCAGSGTSPNDEGLFFPGTALSVTRGYRTPFNNAWLGFNEILSCDPGIRKLEGRHCNTIAKEDLMVRVNPLERDDQLPLSSIRQGCWNDRGFDLSIFRCNFANITACQPVFCFDGLRVNVAVCTCSGACREQRQKH